MHMQIRYLIETAEALDAARRRRPVDRAKTPNVNREGLAKKIRAGPLPTSSSTSRGTHYFYF
jgi:hypothetical protein